MHQSTADRKVLDTIDPQSLQLLLKQIRRDQGRIVYVLSQESGLREKFGITIPESPENWLI
jgi:hypothetical protein